MSRQTGFEKWYFRVIITFFALVVFGPMIYFGAREIWPDPLVGECVKQVDHAAADLTFEEVRCSAAGRSNRSTGREFEVGAIASTCPPGDYTAVPRGDEKTCYLPALSVGVCYTTKQFRNTDRPVHVRVDCKQPGALRSEDIVQDVSDKARCKNPAMSLAFSEPARTVCLAKA
ncbi:hypothetical protein [Lentzea albida]|uniref:Uncharacterized protein n=1 Tax=Lentzea albida TaxID=65499 RepID=A0A1H9J0B6_9PSEU|nr:hypothetical protein [Lentzea albida]SEQ80208.1 hypothetical protein SAMN04488000_104403 [Lentzea albida]